MPNCFTLTPKGQSNPALINAVDEAICRRFQTPVSDKYYCGDWFHVIGFLLATKGFALGSKELRMAVVNWYVASDSIYQHNLTESSKRDARIYLGQQIQILKYLEQYYTSNGWYSRFKT